MSGRASWSRSRGEDGGKRMKVAGGRERRKRLEFVGVGANCGEGGRGETLGGGEWVEEGRNKRRRKKAREKGEGKGKGRRGEGGDAEEESGRGAKIKNGQKEEVPCCRWVAPKIPWLPGGPCQSAATCPCYCPQVLYLRCSSGGNRHRGHCSRACKHNGQRRAVAGVVGAVDGATLS